MVCLAAALLRFELLKHGTRPSSECQVAQKSCQSRLPCFPTFPTCIPGAAICVLATAWQLGSLAAELGFVYFMCGSLSSCAGADRAGLHNDMLRGEFHTWLFPADAALLRVQPSDQPKQVRSDQIRSDQIGLKPASQFQFLQVGDKPVPPCPRPRNPSQMSGSRQQRKSKPIQPPHQHRQAQTQLPPPRRSCRPIQPARLVRTMA